MRLRQWMAVACVTGLVGCGGILPDDDDGEPVIIGTDSGGVQRLSVSEEQVNVSWSGSIDSGSLVSIVAEGSDVFVASGQELRGYDASSGEEFWEVPVSFASGVVALAGPGSGAVFVLTFDSLVAVQVADGSELWRRDLFDLGDPADDALVFGAGALFIGGDPIQRIDPATGDVTDDAPGSSSISDIAVAGSTLYVGAPDGVVALSTSSLGEEWSFDAGGEVDNLAVGALSVFYSVLAGGVGALTLSGNPIGEDQAGEVFQAVAVGTNLFLGARSDGALIAFDETNVAEAWSVAGDSGVRDLAVNEQTVFYASGGGLEGLNLDDGGSLWSFQASGSIVAAEAL